MTYPEWYIVWSYQDKSDFQKDHLLSGFPYFAEIGQYWGAYCSANQVVAGAYPVNWGDHLMLMVIGSSFSVEYALKGVYEKTIGRVTEWIADDTPVEEDIYASRVAKEYADFVHIRPFYEFSFASNLAGLWRQNSLWGRHPIRKWERRAFLSLDYLVEALYCGLITGATHASYGVESADTYARIENARGAVYEENPHLRRVKASGANSEIVIIPRYQEFTDTAIRLAKSGVRFLDIAGNREILLTTILPAGAQYDVPDSQVLFTAGIPARQGYRRVAARCRVSSLHAVLNGMVARGWHIEHVYDY